MTPIMDYFVLFSLCTLACCAATSPAETVEAALGESPSFSCSLPDAAGLKQVTWQRLGRDDSVHTIATYIENFGPQVTEAYTDKVEVILSELNATTFVIKNVTFADDGIYLCIFSVYPSGTKRERKRLNVNGLSEIKTSQTLSPTEKEVVVSCSATGKPEPRISWTSTNKEEPEKKEIQNDDGTVTIISNLTLPLSQYNGKHVECVAEGGTMKSSKHINVKDNNTNTPVTESEGATRGYLATVSVVVICVICAISVGLVLHRRRSKHEKETSGTIV